MDLTDEQLEALCQKIPKVELHCHLFGTVRKDTFIFFNDRAGKPFTDEEITAFYTRGEKPIGVLRVLRALDSQLIKGPEDLYRMTYEYLEDASNHNVKYAEFFWNPTGTVHESHISFEDAQNAIIRAIDDSLTNNGIQGRLICSIDREDTAERAVEMVDWMLQHPHPKTIGVGIDYRETDHPPEVFEKAYFKARENGLRLTAHAGEFGEPWNNVDYVINTLKVSRVDHGYTVLDNPKLVQQCIDEKIVFTVVPTNSYYLRTLKPEEWAQKHPIRQMIKLGMRLHPNTDDPTLHHVNPTKSWFMMVRCFDATIANLKEFMMNGLDAAWIEPEVREQWKLEWSSVFDPYLSK